MAIGPYGVCSSHYCAPQGAPINPRPLTSWTSTTNRVSGNDDKVGVELFKQINTAMNVELTVRSFGLTSWPTITVGKKVSHQIISKLVTSMNTCRSKDGQAAFSWDDYAVGKKVTERIIKELRTNTNTLQSYCICNCNYCTCNCNYCGCDCNYKCTCDCNYNSDKRLKKNIVYL